MCPKHASRETVSCDPQNVNVTSTMKTFFSLCVVCALACFAAPTAHAQANFVVHNARIYTVNPDQPTAEAIAVRGERILMVGSNDQVLDAYPDASRMDAQGQTMVPGLIDAHAHLMGLGTSMIAVDLVGAESKDEVVDRLTAFAANLPADAWLTGRGWDQNDWPEKKFPSRDDLDEAFPERPVWLRRIDGHAAWANSAAIREVGDEILNNMSDPEGGKIIRDERGRPTGVFIDAAMSIIGAKQPTTTDAELDRALQLAIQETARYGLTSVHEAGINVATVGRYQRAIDANEFNIRLYAMIGGRGSTFNYFCENGPILDYGDKLTVRSVKFYMDGALGSRGAALLADYSDEVGNQGLLMETPDSFTASVREAIRCGFQVNTHAIGDRGNRVVIDAYETAMQELGNAGGRHRVEHAQIVSLEDIPRFGSLGIIASMQPTHATSDMYWAEDRVGANRVQGAYAWRKFLDSGAILALGSDFPVERVNPMLGFYAAVTRQDAERWPEGGWYPEENLTRAEALKGFTLDAAYAAFQETEIGSLEPGKYADFVILSKDIMTVPAPEILEAEVISTYIGGQRVYVRE